MGLRLRTMQSEAGPVFLNVTASSLQPTTYIFSLGIENRKDREMEFKWIKGMDEKERGGITKDNRKTLKKKKKTGGCQEKMCEAKV